MKICLPLRWLKVTEHISEDKEEIIDYASGVEPHLPHGAWFLWDIDLRGVPHLPRKCIVDIDQMLYLLRHPFLFSFQNNMLRRARMSILLLWWWKNCVLPLQLHLKEQQFLNDDSPFNIEVNSYKFMETLYIIYPRETEADIEEECQVAEEINSGLNNQVKMI